MISFNKPVQTPKGFKEKFIEVGTNWDFECPNCGVTPPDEKYGAYPKIYNSTSYHNDMGSFYSWEEYHKCLKCKTKFWFLSGN